MSPNQEQANSFRKIIEDKGQTAHYLGRQKILDSQYGGSGSVFKAIQYFGRVTLRKTLPVFPALLSLSCEAIEKKHANTDCTEMGASLSLIAWSADIHDDVIDCSIIKYNKPTVFGKFGASIALLAGDALLIQGSTLLSKECELLNEVRRSMIFESVQAALFEICRAEAKEIGLMKKEQIPPSKILEIIELKAVVPEVFCKIGAIIGQGNAEEVHALGVFGRKYGAAALILEEYLDLLDYDELQSRIKNECLPIPILYGLKDPLVKKKIETLLSKSDFTKENHKELIEIVMNSSRIKTMKKTITSMSDIGIKEIGKVAPNLATKDLSSLLRTISQALQD